MKKREKTLKKASAILAAGVLTTGLMLPGTSVFAYDTVSTAATTLTVTGIEEGSTVYAYPIVLDTQDDKGNHEWIYGTGVEDRIKNGIDAADTYYFYTNLNTGTESTANDAQGAAIAKKTLVYTLNGNGGNYSAQVPAGLYVITAQKEGSNVSYNATVVPVNYTYGADGTAAPQDPVTAAVKKSDKPELKKEVVENNTPSKHHSAKIGDTVNFKISVTIPSYDDTWNTGNLKYIISDTLSEGLTLDENSISYTGTDITVSANAAKVTTPNSFTITLTGADVFNNKGKTLEITYSATINENAAVNFDKDTNTASLMYSTRANSTDMSSPEKDETKHYTFGIDTAVNGTGSKVTEEVTKMGIHKTENGTEAVELAGAQFQLLDADGNVLHFTSDGKLDPTDDPDDDTDYLDHVTSGKDGSLKIEGLDEGTYTLKESKAPQGYALSNVEYPVTISAEYNDTTGELTSYTVRIGDGESAATFEHKKQLDGSITASAAETFEINNTTMAELPSTGGAGVMVVTLVGTAMMGGFGAIFLSLKKKRS